jgi:hypothetical protein
MTSRRCLLALGCALALTATTAQASDDLGGVPEGRWRVSRGIVAPWMEDGSSVDRSAWLGATLEFSHARFAAPQGLGCDTPSYEAHPRPPQGLFQGGLDEGPEDAAKLAASLALTRPDTPSVTLTCDSGVFDLHWATPQALMLAVDNVIWVLDRSPGALAASDTPEAAVQQLLETHYAGDLGFVPDSVEPKRKFLSVGLLERIAAYFAAPFPTDEPPPINGDPFTNSQDYPVLFSVGTAATSNDTAEIAVRYDDGYRPRSVVFLLRREASQWRIDDLRYDDGITFRALLATEP